MTACRRALRRFTFIAAVLMICGAATVARADQFLSAEIEEALSARTEFLRRVDLSNADFLNFREWVRTIDLASLSQFQERLASASESAADAVTWYYFLSGLMESVLMKADSASVAVFYNDAQAAAASDPGALWLLALEFLRNDQIAFASGTLTELEKQIFTRGASSAPLLSQQLMLFGNIIAPNNPEYARFCYDWAKRFDNDQPWTTYNKGRLDFSSNALSAIPAFISETWGLFFRSWNMQVEFAHGVYKILAVALFFFMCAIFLVLLIKYLPSGVHSMGDTFFGAASPGFRVMSCVVIVLSVLSFGLVPFLWVGAFLIRRFPNAAEKKLLTCACLILALCPLDAVMSNFFLRHTARTAPAVVFDRIVKEGYSESLHKLIEANVKRMPGSGLSQISLALSWAKSGDVDQSIKVLHNARKENHLDPHDPVVLMYAGNISFWADNIEAMEELHEQLLKGQPKNAEAMYNLAQAQFLSEGFAASDKVAEASKIKPELIGEFMKMNDLYYEGDIPPLRKLIQPPITPGYFWRNVFLSDIGETFNVGRGARSFFGLGPLTLFGVSVALLIALFALDATVWNGYSKSGKQYFICRICGRLICRRCRKGTMCLTCYKASLDAHNSAASMYNLQRRCQENSALVRDITTCALGMFVPGAEQLYKNDSERIRIGKMTVTCLIFAALYCAATFATDYPSRTVISLGYFVSILLIYNIVAFVKQGLGAANVLRNFVKLRAKQN